MTDATATPMTTDAGYRLEYIVGDEQWHAETWRTGNGDDPTLVVSKSGERGGWEFHIHDRSAKLQIPAVQVRIFDDAFAAFAEIGPFFTTLAAEQPTNLDQVREILDLLGFVDATERQMP